LFKDEFETESGKAKKKTRWIAQKNTLGEAERSMLNLYCQRAQLVDGQRVLDIGCGWGSFSLYAAERYPHSTFVAVSNSSTQKTFIDQRAREKGLKNLIVITCDINQLTWEIIETALEQKQQEQQQEQQPGDGGESIKHHHPPSSSSSISSFVNDSYPSSLASSVSDLTALVDSNSTPSSSSLDLVSLSNSITDLTCSSSSCESGERIGGVRGRRGEESRDEKPLLFDRLISIECFEHMKNYQLLLAKLSSFVQPSIGLFFIHIFVHRSTPYQFNTDNWLSRYFFTGGNMPSSDLLLYFQDKITLQQMWSVNGNHYSRTAQEWLHRMDENWEKIIRIFHSSKKGCSWKEAEQYARMWRVFFVAVEETFKFNRGEEWFVAHYLFQNK